MGSGSDLLRRHRDADIQILRLRGLSFRAPLVVRPRRRLFLHHETVERVVAVKQHDSLHVAAELSADCSRRLFARSLRRVGFSVGFRPNIGPRSRCEQIRFVRIGGSWADGRHNTGRRCFCRRFGTVHLIGVEQQPVGIDPREPTQNFCSKSNPGLLRPDSRWEMPDGWISRISASRLEVKPSSFINRCNFSFIRIFFYKYKHFSFVKQANFTPVNYRQRSKLFTFVTSCILLNSGPHSHLIYYMI